MSVFTYVSGFKAGNEHDKIQRDLVRGLEEYSKRHLQDVSWSGDPYPDRQYKDDSVIKSEKRISGDLPSGKTYCRADVTLRVGDEQYAFEIKTSASDAKNWPEQERDYRAAGYVPVVIVTPQVVVDLAPGHRLVTDSHHGYASEYDIHINTEALPQTLINHFGDGTPIDEPKDHCPECGFNLHYLEHTDGIYHRCQACDWRES